MIVRQFNQVSLFEDIHSPVVARNIEKLPTNTLSSRHRVQRWANFIAGFSIEFVESCLANSKNTNAKSVLDPFLGCGTTLVVGREKGLLCWGYELHPIFHELAKSKLQAYTRGDLLKVYNLLESNISEVNWSEDARIFLSKLFGDVNLAKINKASAALSKIEAELRPLAIALFFKACEKACGSQTDGIYKAPTSTKKTIPFESALILAREMFLEDINSEWYKSEYTTKVNPRIFNSSSTSMEEIADSSIDICVTSPPYLNNFDFAEMTRMHLYLLGWAESWSDISKKIRNHLITNTTTALKGKTDSEYQSKCLKTIPETLKDGLMEIVSELKRKKAEKLGSKNYEQLVLPYYSEIFSVIKELYRVLNSDGEVNWVVSDAALYGVHIKTQDHTKILFESAGFEHVEVIKMRARGHRWILSKREGADEGLGEYHIIAKKKI